MNKCFAIGFKCFTCTKGGICFYKTILAYHCFCYSNEIKTQRWNGGMAKNKNIKEYQFKLDFKSIEVLKWCKGNKNFFWLVLKTFFLSSTEWISIKNCRSQIRFKSNTTKNVQRISFKISSNVNRCQRGFTIIKCKLDEQKTNS